MQICGRRKFRAQAHMAVLSCLLSSAIVSGCAGVPSSFELSQTFGHRPDGSFVLSAWERGLNCERLNEALTQRLSDMEKIAADERTERQGLPPTILAAISWSSGNPLMDGKRFKAHGMKQAEAIGYRDAMRAKSCSQSIDLQQRFAELEMPRNAHSGTSLHDLPQPEL